MSVQKAQFTHGPSAAKMGLTYKVQWHKLLLLALMYSHRVGLESKRFADTFSNWIVSSVGPDQRYMSLMSCKHFAVNYGYVVRTGETSLHMDSIHVRINPAHWFTTFRRNLTLIFAYVPEQMDSLPFPIARFQSEGGEHANYEHNTFYYQHTTRHGSRSGETFGANVEHHSEFAL